MKRKALFIGGTGTISTAISNQAVLEGWDLYVINRGNRNNEIPGEVHVIQADIENEQEIIDKLAGMSFDCVCDFIGFVLGQVERDYRIFAGKTKQFMYISSASAYHKPVRDYRITEATTLANPYWEYSRNKIICEEYLMDKYRKEGFPVTIIRPSHTYGNRSVPMGVHGNKGSYQVLKRMKEGKPVIIHGDGTSLWTLTYNTDFAAGFIGLMGNPHAIGEAFQITSDETLTWNQIHEIIADALGVKLIPYHVSSDFLAAVSNYGLDGGLMGDKARSVVFDNTKLKRAVPGFSPVVRFEQGVRYCLDYIETHPECQVEDPEFDAWSDRVIETLESAKKSLI